MIPKTKKLLSIALCFAAAFWSIPADAAVIVSAGSTLNEPNWVDNGFGKDAYFFFASSGSLINSSSNINDGLIHGGSSRSSFETPSLSTGSVVYNSANSNRFTYAAIQAPGGVGTIPTGVAMRTGLSDNNSVDLVSFTFNSDIVGSYRIGVLIANNFHNDGTIPGEIKLIIGSASAAVPITRPANSTAQADWYFFDITGLTAADTLTIASNRYSADSPAKIAGISGVTFTAVPEPSTVVMTAMLLAGAALFRRRSLRSV